MLPICCLCISHDCTFLIASSAFSNVNLHIFYSNLEIYFSVLSTLSKLLCIIGITYNSDTKWKTLRRFTLQALRDFGVGKKSLEEKIFEEIDVVSEILKNSNETPIRVKPLLLSAATNIICNVMFGER